MAYTIDIKQIPLMKYMMILQHQNLLPGRKILQNEIEANFQRIAETGIVNLLELKSCLSSPVKLSALSEKAYIPEDYLIILKRELRNLEQKPVPISDFPGINEETTLKLLSRNIRNSKDLYNLFHTKDDIKEVLTDINEYELNELYCLCNLVRINGVGAAAARTLHESGYKDIAAIAQDDAHELLNKISEANSVGHYYNAKLGLKDMQFIIDYANLLVDLEMVNDK